jgi:hypothetical protein
MFAGETVDPKAYEYLIAKNVASCYYYRILAPFWNVVYEFIEAKSTKDGDMKDAYAYPKAHRLQALRCVLY